ncbi:DUF481 domain-containing protein [Sphaerotilus uruguayifluvii]|uniref:Salt-induced outer membrane protein YdiY n=1 Tax=Sphaerotilus uruguayifluvii TaxID=2735897 RepID=A0ABX2G0W1_9BURK|nr:DUF481 domain-containing protein [Leptothrix sp. C29]NRT55938.1 putative salt-induced outer membrane protein YdiY [Leptothrix sp. C29]
MPTLMNHRLASALLSVVALGAAAAAQAQTAAPAAPAATQKADGRFRAALGLGASLSSGNSRTSSFSLAGQGVRITDQDKLGVQASALYASSQGTTTAEQLRAGARYDYNLGPSTFAFGLADLEHNRPANLSLRGVVGAGAGLHLIRTETDTLDVFGGLAWNADRYVDAALVAGEMRSSYNYAAVLLGEESQHRLSDTVSVFQRLTVYPNLRERGEFRASFGSGLAVALSNAMNLNVGLSYAYNSDPGAGRKKGDTLLTTGVSVKFD